MVNIHTTTRAHMIAWLLERGGEIRVGQVRAHGARENGVAVYFVEVDGRTVIRSASPLAAGFDVAERAGSLPVGDGA